MLLLSSLQATRIRWFRTAALALACALATRSSGSAALPELPKRPLTLKVVGEAVGDLLAGLETENEKYTAAGGLANLKLDVQASGVPADRVLTAVAGVLGAEWRCTASGELARFELRRTRAIVAWEAEWQQARRAAERRARQVQFETIAQHVREGLTALSNQPGRDAAGRDVEAGESYPASVVDPGYARVVASLSPTELEAIVCHMAEQAPLRDGDVPSPAPPPLIKRFTDLTPRQEQAVRKVLPEPGAPDLSPVWAERLRDLSQLVLSFDGDEGIAIGVYFYGPGGDRWGGAAVGRSTSAAKLETAIQTAILSSLSRRATPPDALLGSAPTRDGNVSPPVRIADEKLALARPALPEFPLDHEFLKSMAEGTGLPLVSDHHSRSRRVRLPAGATVREQLEAASGRFGRVYAVRDGILMSRSIYWPDRDQEEAPAPWFEQWIHAKQSGRGLRLEDIYLMGSLPRLQLCSLGAYRDGSVHFQSELASVRGAGWLWSLMKELPAADRKKAESDAGMPLGRLSLRKRIMIQSAVGIRADWAAVRLFVTQRASPYNPGDRMFRGMLGVFQGERKVPLWTSP